MHDLKLESGLHARTTAEDGAAVVEVAVAGAAKYATWNPNVTHPYAIVDAEDFDRLAAAGFPMDWQMGGRPYPAVLTRTSRRVRVARVIAMPLPSHGKGRSACIKYLDGNPLNLRKGNLAVSAQRGGKWSTPPHLIRNIELKEARS